MKRFKNKIDLVAVKFCASCVITSFDFELQLELKEKFVQLELSRLGWRTIDRPNNSNNDSGTFLPGEFEKVQGKRLLVSPCWSEPREIVLKLN